MLHSLEEEKVDEKSWDEEALEEEDDLGDFPSLPPKGSGTGKSRMSIVSEQFDAKNKVQFVVHYMMLLHLQLIILTNLISIWYLLSIIRAV
jgi:hypothetical protein